MKREAASDAALAERRKSIRPFCLSCAAKEKCSLSRAAWFDDVMRLRSLGPDATLFVQGGSATKVYVVKTGWLRGIHSMPNGKEVSEIFGPGSLLGLDCSDAGLSYSYTARAIGECEVEEAPAADFMERLARDRYVAVDLIRLLSSEVARVREHFYSTAAKKPTADRVKEVLQELAEKCGSVTVDGHIRIEVPLPAQVLADMTGCSRQWATEVLKELEDAGLISRCGCWVTIWSDTSRGR